MNIGIIDKAIEMISPRLAYKREAWRQGFDMLRNYDAGKRDRLNMGFGAVDTVSPEMTDKQYRDTIRARARDLERNSDVANSIISAFVRNIIGKGLTLQARTPNEEINTQLEKLWQEWQKPRNCDAYRISSFPELMQIIVRRCFVDGGILIYKVFTPGGLVPFAIQLIEVDEFDIGAIKPTLKENKIVEGVELDSYGVPVGYWIKQYQPDGSPGLEGRFIPAKDIIFYYRKTRPAQVREISGMAQTIGRIKDITSFMEAVAVKERISACVSLAVTTELPNGTGFLGRRNNGPAGFAGYEGVSFTPGMVQRLAPGEKIELINPSQQGSSASEFVQLQQRLSSSGQGLSYETTSRDLSQVNYSSARQGLIEDELSYGMEQDSLIYHVLREIYETFVISAVLAGLVDIQDLFNPEVKQEYLAHVFVPPGRKWIDPLREANANKIALQNGLKTFQQVCLEQGGDWREVINDMAAAQEYARQKGVNIFAPTST